MDKLNNEKKLETLEEEEPDALEMAEKAYEEGKKEEKEQIILSNFLEKD